MKKILFVVAAFSCLAYSQQDADLYYGTEYNNKFFLKAGFGTGAAYGGWYGAGVEVGYGIISATGGLGGIYPNTYVGTGDFSPEGKLGWQAGLKIYFNAEDNRFRPSLAIHYGQVFPYYIHNTTVDDVEGVYNAFTPCLLFENKLGKKEKVGLTYGIGPVLHEAIPEDDKQAIRSVTGKDIIVNLSLVFGVNFLIF